MADVYSSYDAVGNHLLSTKRKTRKAPSGTKSVEPPPPSQAELDVIEARETFAQTGDNADYAEFRELERQLAATQNT